MIRSLNAAIKIALMKKSALQTFIQFTFSLDVHAQRIGPKKVLILKW